MGYYENLKCGKCKYSFTGGYIRSNGFMKTYLGVPYIVCPECQNINRTGLKPWSSYHFLEKIYHWTSVLIRTFIYSFFISLLISHLIVEYLIKTSNFSLKLTFAVVFTIGILGYFILRELEEIKDVEKEYEKITS